MTTNMTTGNLMTLDQTDESLDWMTLVPDGVTPGHPSSKAPAPRMTASEIERADYEAARQLGAERRARAGRQAGFAALNNSSKISSSPRTAASEIEHADYEAARQLGAERQTQAGRPAGPAALNNSSKISSRNGLADDPRQWPGRKIRKRSTQAMYTVRQVFDSGKVELEKSFMLYLSDVKTVRSEYERA